eukprot:m.167236 g.167236  ORF g.167236 m.167236 type:complete len:365 (+) comp18188_c0_seq1:197-1291(+)
MVAPVNVTATSAMRKKAADVALASFECFSSNSEKLHDTVPESVISASRAAKYRPILKNVTTTSAAYAASLFALLTFLATPHGVGCVLFGIQLCSAFISLDYVGEHPFTAFLIGGFITGIVSVATFLPFARFWDKLYNENPQARCQQSKSYAVYAKPFFGRLEVQLAISNLLLAAFLTSAIAVTAIVAPTWVKIYSKVEDYGWPYFFFSSILYFLFIDLWAYLGHRVLHFPWLYKRVHKVHHSWKQTTAFVGLGLHPFDMMILQAGVYTAFFLFPIHIAGVALNLLYIHYHNVIDHSGVYCESWLPWQPSSLYHDDHHRCFHMNYGQSLTIWDELGGTFFKSTATYNEGTFSDFTAPGNKSKGSH